MGVAETKLTHHKMNGGVEYAAVLLHHTDRFQSIDKLRHIIECGYLRSGVARPLKKSEIFIVERSLSSPASR